MNKVNEWLEENGFTRQVHVAEGTVDIFKGGEKVVTLSGSELSVNNTADETIEILKAKLNYE